MDESGVSLRYIVTQFGDQIFRLYHFTDNIFPFSDFPNLSLWDIFMSSTLLMFALLFVPGFSRLDDDTDEDNTINDSDVKNAFNDFLDDDFDDF